jgi:hypothetical protein
MTRREGQVKLVPYVDIPSDIYYDDHSTENMHRLVDSLSSAFRVGAINTNLIVRGLKCLGTIYRCQVCTGVCQSFPLKSVVCFENQNIAAPD